MKKNSNLRDYHKYQWSVREIIPEIVKALFVVFLLAWFFYRSVWAVLPLSVVGIAFFQMQCVKKAEQCREELSIQFKECILSVVACMRAGYAVENAFVESRNDMRLLYGEEAPIYEELECIRRGLVINITLEELLTDLGKRSDNEDIIQFAQVFAIAKRSGGNMAEVIRSTAMLIGQRIDTKQEIRTALSGRRMEQAIMRAMPFGILFYIGLSYPGYFDDLYHNLRGVAIMTICLLVYLAAYVLGDQIMKKIAREMG